MVITRYKPLFSLTARYELAATGVSSDGIGFDIPFISQQSMSDLKLKPLLKNNTVTVFFEGKETPADAPTTCEPALEITTDNYFYFPLLFSSKEKIKGLKFHTSAASAKEIGFPVLYDGFIAALNGPTGITLREDVKIMPPVFTLTVTQAETGLDSSAASLEIKDEKNTRVDLPVDPARLNDKSIDGPGAVPEYAFSVDASALLPGIYQFKTGTWQKKFFISPKMDLTEAVSLIRVLKNNFLAYKKSLADNSLAAFDLLIPKA